MHTTSKVSALILLGRFVETSAFLIATQQHKVDGTGSVRPFVRVHFTLEVAQA